MVREEFEKGTFYNRIWYYFFLLNFLTSSFLLLTSFLLTMDWQLLGLSFIAVFLSELGDKSQLAAIALGGSSKFPQAVFLATATALLLTTFLGVLVGQGIAEILPTNIVKVTAAIGFAIMGIRLLLSGEEEPEESENS